MKFGEVINRNPMLLEELGNALSTAYTTNWKHLAGVMKKELTYIHNCESKETPGQKLLLDWSTHKDATVENLLSLLAEISRDDIVEKLETRTGVKLSQDQRAVIEKKRKAEQDKPVASRTRSRTENNTSNLRQNNIVVCLLAARDKEAFAARLIFEQEGKVKFNPAENTQEFCFQRGVLEVGSRKADIIISFAREQGENFTMDVTKDFISAFRPTLALMTGVCAGNRSKTKLGDIVIAEKAFFFKIGKETNWGFKPSPDFFGPNEQFLKWVKLTMEGKEEWKQYPKGESGLSKRFKKQWLLRAFYEYARNPNESKWLSKNQFDTSQPIALNDCVEKLLGEEYRDLVEEMIRENEIFMDPQGDIKVAELIEGEIKKTIAFFGDYPLADKKTSKPQALFGIYGTGPSLRTDDKADSKGVRRSRAFEECEAIHGDTMAIDRECAAFYQAAEKHKETHALVVKGISGHADSDDDDSFHEYGKQLSASFVLAVVREYINQNAAVDPSNDN